MSANQRDEVYRTPCPGPPVDDRGVLDVRHEASVLAWPERSTRHQEGSGGRHVSSVTHQTSSVHFILHQRQFQIRIRLGECVCAWGRRGGGNCADLSSLNVAQKMI